MSAADQQGNKTLLQIVAVSAVLLVLAGLTWFLVARDGSDPTLGENSETSYSATPDGPRIASVDEIRALPDILGHSVYWAGERQGQNLELTVLSNGSAYVRYLPDGVSAGVDEPDYLTVATYPQDEAYERLQSSGQQPGAIRVKDQGGALVVSESADSTSTYFAFDYAPLLMEVYDAKPGRAFTLVQSGQIQPVG